MLSEDPEVQFRLEDGDDFGDLPADQRPQVRHNVDAGVEVIDLNAMRAELEAARAQRHQPREG